jgi:hypothetical protein
MTALATATVITPAIASHDADNDGNIIANIVSAPVVTNGLVAGEPTELNVILDARNTDDSLALDTHKFGHQIPAGGWMEIELGGSFTRARDPQTGELFPVGNANVLMVIAQLNPIFVNAGDGPQFGNVSVIDSGSNVITLKPNGGEGRNGIEGARAREIGMKVIHLRPNPADTAKAVFFNGPAGTVGSIAVRTYNRNGKLVESGFGDVMFEASVGRQVHVTNVGLASPLMSPNVELVESSNFQYVEPDTRLENTAQAVPFSAGAPYAPRFLLFESLEAGGKSFIPQPGIDNVGYQIDAERPWVASLLENGERVGSIVMSGPDADNRGTLLPSDALTTLGGNGSVFSVPVQVGHKKGVYTVTVSFVGGGKAVNTIVVKSEHDDD